jgi:hypothetical protein
MHGQCLDYKTSDWFEFKTPKTTHLPDLIKNYLSENRNLFPGKNQRVIWIGDNLLLKPDGDTLSKVKWMVSGKNITIELKPDEKLWLTWLLNSASVNNELVTYEIICKKYEDITHEDFDYFVTTKPWKALLQAGLLII